MLLSGGVTYTTVMVNDTMPIKAITEMIGATVGFENAIGAESVTALANGLFFSIFIFFSLSFLFDSFFFHSFLNS